MRVEPPAPPFFFEDRTGVALAGQVRKYAAWLLPLLKQRWVPDDLSLVYAVGHPWRPKEPEFTPLVPEKQLFITRQICRMREWRPWAQWALDALVVRRLPVNVIAAGDPVFEERVYGDYQPAKETVSYTFPRQSGLLRMKDLLHFDMHVRSLMEKRREPELDERFFLPGSEPT